MDDDLLLELASSEDEPHFTPEFVDTKVSECNLEEVEGAIRARTQLRNSHKLTQYSAEVAIAAESPVTIVLWGDQHYGSGDGDHERILRDLHLIRDTPGVYCVLMGNLIDNSIPGKFPDGMLQNVIPPEEQVVAMRKHLEDLNSHGKVLGAVTCPCHEGWTWQKAGQDINRLLYDFQGRTFPVMENGCKLTIKVNGISYYFALYHQVGPFNSNLNKNNGPQRMKQLQHPEADVVAAAHHHTAEAMQTYSGKQSDQRPTCYLRTGCYKLDDQWAGGKGYVKGEPGGQSVRLYHTEKKMQPTLDILTAIEEHKALQLLYRYRALKE